MDELFDLYDILFAYTAFFAIKHKDEFLISSIDIVLNQTLKVWTIEQNAVFLFDSLEIFAATHPDQSHWVPFVFLRRKFAKAGITIKKSIYK